MDGVAAYYTSSWHTALNYVHGMVIAETRGRFMEYLARMALAVGQDIAIASSLDFRREEKRAKNENSGENQNIIALSRLLSPLKTQSIASLPILDLLLTSALQPRLASATSSKPSREPKAIA